jgi:hypothetical protein
MAGTKDPRKQYKLGVDPLHKNKQPCEYFCSIEKERKATPQLTRDNPTTICMQPHKYEMDSVFSPLNPLQKGETNPQPRMNRPASIDARPERMGK